MAGREQLSLYSEVVVVALITPRLLVQITSTAPPRGPAACDAAASSWREATRGPLPTGYPTRRRRRCCCSRGRGGRQIRSHRRRRHGFRDVHGLVRAAARTLHASVYVVSVVIGFIAADPEVALVPVQPPEAVRLVAFVADHVSVVRPARDARRLPVNVTAGPPAEAEGCCRRPSTVADFHSSHPARAHQRVRGGRGDRADRLRA